MSEPLHLTIIIKDDMLRTMVSDRLALTYGQDRVRTFRTRDEFDEVRFGTQLFQVDGVIIAHADAPDDLAAHIAQVRESVPDARIIVIRKPGEAFALENVECDIFLDDAKLPERVTRALQPA